MSALVYRKLEGKEIEEGLSALPQWKIEGGKLTRTFEFPTYKDGVVFASAVGFVADKLNHHPDIAIGYGKVQVAVNTHDVGGISPYDFELARRVNGLLASPE